MTKTIPNNAVVVHNDKNDRGDIYFSWPFSPLSPPTGMGQHSNFHILDGTTKGLRAYTNRV